MNLFTSSWIWLNAYSLVQSSSYYLGKTFYYIGLLRCITTLCQDRVLACSQHDGDQGKSSREKWRAWKRKNLIGIGDPTTRIRAKKENEMLLQKEINTYQLNPKVSKKSPRYIWSKGNNNVLIMSLQLNLFLYLI